MGTCSWADHRTGDMNCPLSQSGLRVVCQGSNQAAESQAIRDEFDPASGLKQGLNTFKD